MWPCIVTNFFIIKPTRCTNFTNLFWHETLHVSDQDGLAVPSWSCSKAVYKPVWHIPLLSVQWINSWWWTEELSETCRVSCQNKFVKLVHLVGLIIKRTVITFLNMNTMGDSNNHCVHNRGNGMTIWEEPWMQSPERPSLLSYSCISYSVVHFKQGRGMAQTQKHKTTVNFLSTCDKTDELYINYQLDALTIIYS